MDREFDQSVDPEFVQITQNFLDYWTQQLLAQSAEQQAKIIDGNYTSLFRQLSVGASLHKTFATAFKLIIDLQSYVDQTKHIEDWLQLLSLIKSNFSILSTEDQIKYLLVRGKLLRRSGKFKRGFSTTWLREKSLRSCYRVNFYRRY